MALAIKISSYISGGYTNPVIWRLYENVTGTFVDDHQEMGPHGVVYNFAFTENIRDIIYRIDLYEQPGGTGTGTLIKSHVLSVTTSTVTFDADIELIVDGGEDYDPVSGQSTTLPNPNLVGKDYYVEQRGVGKLRDQRSVEVTTDNTVGNGTFSLLGGAKFNPEDTYIVKIRPQFVVNPSGSQGLGLYKDVVFVDEDKVLTGTDFGKLFIVDGVTKVVTIQLPAIADILEKLSVWIQSVGTTHNNVVIKAATGETIKANGLNLNTFILSKAMKAEIILLSGNLYGICDDSDVRNRGKIEFAHTIGLNRVVADGSQLLISEYPGLKQAFDNLPANSVCTETQWNSSSVQNYVLRSLADGSTDFQETKTVYPYKGKYAATDDGLSIIVPDLRNKFIRGLKFINSFSDSERIVQDAGGYQMDDFKGHTHAEDTSEGVGGSGKTTVGNETTEGTLLTRITGGVETRGENIGLIPQLIF
jgi:hypothetical protein